MRHALLILAILPMAACNVFQKDVARGYEENRHWTTAAAYSTADIRIITQRRHPVLNNDVLCTEPSPDVAKALSTAAQLNAQGGNAAVTAGVGAAGGSGEAVAELAGRSTAVLGLRDGLYHACEAFANGSIGADAYALVLSRYGQLMTTLFLGQDITGAAGAEGKASIAAAIQALGNQQPGGSAPTTTTGGKKSSANTPPVTVAAQIPAARRAATPATPAQAKVILAAATRVAQTAAPAATGQATTAAATTALVKTGATPGATPTAPTGSATPTPAPTTPSTAGVAATAALAITRMNEDFFNLDFNLLNLLVVACINEMDPTRLRATKKDLNNQDVPVENPWLVKVCDEIDNIKTIAELDKEGASLATQLGLTPINPAPGVAQNQAQASAKKPTTAENSTVVAAQTALKRAGEDPGKLDGVMGPSTIAAIRKYQTEHALTVNGQLDEKTLKQLNVQ